MFKYEEQDVEYIIEMQRVDAEKYDIVMDKSPDGAPATATERRLEWYLDVCSYTKELVIKTAKLKNQLSKKTFMSRENVEWLVHEIEQLSFDDEKDEKGYRGGISCRSLSLKNRQNISHPNFSLQTELLRTRKTTIRVISSDGFEKLGMIFHGGFGTGIKKNFPSMIERTNRTKNPLHLKNGDIVNVLNCPLHQFQSHNISGWFDDEAHSFNKPLSRDTKQALADVLLEFLPI